MASCCSSAATYTPGDDNHVCKSIQLATTVRGRVAEHFMGQRANRNVCGKPCTLPRLKAKKCRNKADKVHRQRSTAQEQPSVGARLPENKQVANLILKRIDPVAILFDLASPGVEGAVNSFSERQLVVSVTARHGNRTPNNNRSAHRVLPR